MSDPAKGRDGRKRAGSRKAAPRDWAGVKARFVAADMTTREFAAAEGIPYSTIAKRAAADGWDAARAKAREKAAAGVVDKAVRHRIRSESEIDGQAHRAASRFARHVGRMLTGVERLTLDDAQKVKAAVEALEKAHRLARVTAHLPAEPTATIAEQRVEVIVRGVDEFGEAYEERPDSDGGPERLQADGDAGGVPPVA